MLRNTYGYKINMILGHSCGSVVGLAMHIRGGEARQRHGQCIGLLPNACESLSILELDAEYSQNLPCQFAFVFASSVTNCWSSC